MTFYRKRCPILVEFLAFFSLLTVGDASEAISASKPNIIIIVADDLVNHVIVLEHLIRFIGSIF